MNAAGLYTVAGREGCRQLLVVKVKSPGVELSRESSATSDGELTRVGTCGVGNVGGPLVRPTFDAAGIRRRSRRRHWWAELLAGIRPVNVALVIVVGPVSTKSSADSISNAPPEPGRDAVAINPLGSPVVKKNGVPEAAAGWTLAAPTTATAATAATTGSCIYSPSRFIAWPYRISGRNVIEQSVAKPAGCSNQCDVQVV